VKGEKSNDLSIFTFHFLPFHLQYYAMQYKSATQQERNAYSTARHI